MYEALGNETPKATDYHQACKICFPRGAALEGASSESASDTDISSSDSSESFEEEEAESPIAK